MKLIIAGGRSYYLTAEDYKKLDRIDIAEVVSGGASGADTCGENYAKKINVPTIVFKADWSKYGRKAGPLRNKQMAEYADGVALFPGGTGHRINVS